MNIVLTCPECSYRHEGLPEKTLINKIAMWNHSKKAHPKSAERIMNTYQVLPGNFYSARTEELV